MKKTYISGLVSIMLMAPLMASAQTTDVQTQIRDLLAQIETLKTRIIELSKANGGVWGNASSTMPWGQVKKDDDRRPCLAMREFKMGERSDEVRELQKLMKEDKFMNVNPTGYFGSMSQNAFKMFKQKHGKGNCGMGGFMGDPKDMMFGTTTAVSANIITITNRNGESKTFAVASTTKVGLFIQNSQPKPQAISDIAVGEFVGIGFTMKDGAMTALHIMENAPVRPPMPMMQGGQGMMRPMDDDHRGRGRGNDDGPFHY